MIEVTLNVKGQILVWDTAGIKFLREDCRIFGKFIGTVARAPHQSQLKGLPIKLGFEELVTLMTENGDNVSLVFVKSILSEDLGRISDIMKDQHKESLKRNHSEMCTILLDERNRKMNENFKNYDNRKRKADSNMCSLPPEDGVLVHLPTSTPKLWIRDDEKTIIILPQSKALSQILVYLVNVWKSQLKFDVSEEMIIKSAVFHRLWLQKQYNVTLSCKKMGGDYLLYPGDPWTSHSSHVVRVLPSSLELYPSELISSVRLISSIKKSCIFAWYSFDSSIHLSLDDIASLLASLQLSFNCFSWCGIVP